MTIAFLRTPQADSTNAFNKLEFEAASHGARAVAYVSAGEKGTFRGLPLVTPSDLASLGVDMVVSPLPVSADELRMLTDAGWPVSRVMSHTTEREQCRALWSQNGGQWMAARRPGMTGTDLAPAVQYAQVGGPAVGKVVPELDATALLAITTRAFEAFQLSRADAPTSGPYAIGRNWGNFLRASRPNFYAAVEKGDVDTIDALLADCLRNEMTTGTFGSGVAYEAYNSWVAAGSAIVAGVRAQYNVWRYCVSNPDVARLASPPVGNPFGVWLDHGIVHANTFLNDCRAQFVTDLLAPVDRPLVLDLGGGFGGFGHQLLTNGSNAVYVGFDLPENLIVATYFLMAAHPEKRVLLYQSRDQVLDARTLREYDIVLMPNFMLPQVPNRTVNLFTNFISLSEMDYASIAEYLRQVDRVTDGFFYHENLLDNGENYEFYPVSVFPALSHFKTLWTAPSRWPFFSPSSPHHCHGEVLAARRDIDVARYFGTSSRSAVEAALGYATAL
ncbi:MAG: putative sugar O-methyltransferase [Vicinamibacterales bacterium]